MPRGSKPPSPAKSAGRTRTVAWRGMSEEEYVPVSQLDGAQQAAIHGRCARCDNPYRVGDWVFRNGSGELVGVNCCATAGDAKPAGDPVPLGYGDMGEDDAEGRDFVPASQVMPTGKSRADMCLKCFQIPAANGVCGC